MVDIRPESYRTEEGELPGAVVVDRNHLEWWLDPTSHTAVPQAARPARDHRLQRGVRLSLAAATLQQLGVPRDRPGRRLSGLVRRRPLDPERKDIA